MQNTRFQQPMIDTQITQMADDFAQRIQSQGLTMEQYFQFTGLTAGEDDGRVQATGCQENRDPSGTGSYRKS